MDFFPVSIQSQNPQNPIWEKKNPQIQFHGFLLRRPVPFVFLSRGITYPNPGIYSCGGRALPLLRRRRSRFNLSASMPSSTPSAISAFGF
jgi:hypothetical protein